MYFDRFDIVEAWYIYLIENVNGQNSKEYRRLSRLLSYFEPRGGLRDFADLSENSQEIYNNISY